MPLPNDPFPYFFQSALLFLLLPPFHSNSSPAPRCFALRPHLLPPFSHLITHTRHPPCSSPLTTLAHRCHLPDAPHHARAPPSFAVAGSAVLHAAPCPLPSDPWRQPPPSPRTNPPVLGSCPPFQTLLFLLLCKQPPCTSDAPLINHHMQTCSTSSGTHEAQGGARGARVHGLLASDWHAGLADPQRAAPCLMRLTTSSTKHLRPADRLHACGGVLHLVAQHSWQQASPGCCPGSSRSLSSAPGWGDAQGCAAAGPLLLGAGRGLARLA